MNLLKTIALGLSAFAFMPATAQAGENHWLDPAWHFVPATDCVPASPADAALLNVYWGAWIFDGTKTGTANIICNLPFSNGFFDPEHGWISTQFYEKGDISYRDSTGTATTASVKTQLVIRQRNSGTVLLPNQSFNSDSFSTTTDNTRDVDWGNSVTMAGTDLSAHVRVTLMRSSSSQVVAFSGLRWHELFIP